MAQDIAGWGCIIVGLVLVGVHIVKTFAPRATTPGKGADEGVGAIAEKLAESSPNLAGALAFVILGLVVLGLIDVSVAAGTTGGESGGAGG